jgi:hypothetical protein
MGGGALNILLWAGRDIFIKFGSSGEREREEDLTLSNY